MPCASAARVLTSYAVAHSIGRTMQPHEAIAALLAAGETETAIAKAVGVSQSTINRIRHRGHSPRFDLGAALIQLAEARKGKRKSSKEARNAA
jgi:IS30 family transposase